MSKQTFDIDKLRIASPCPAGWQTMKGDERTRHCDLCQLNVYNVAEMTRAEVENLVANREGRLCMRLYKRADGTVLTRDCPVGWRAYQKRAARFAGAALATVLGLFSISFGQKDKKALDAAKLNITRVVSQETFLEGTITDMNGAVVPNAEILIFRDKINVATVKSDENGYYKFSSLAPGLYALEVKGDYGFKPYKVKNLKINDREGGTLNISLKGDDGFENIGVVLGDIGATVDMSSTSVQTTITKDMMNRLPH